MSGNHVFQLLEDLVEELNPSVIPYPLTQVRVSMLSQEIKRLDRHIKETLQELFFRTVGNEATAELVGKCYFSLIILMNKTYFTREHQLVGVMNVKSLQDDLLAVMEKVFFWLNQKFSSYIKDDQPYPITSLLPVRAAILEEMESLSALLKAEGNTDEAVNIIVVVMQDFVRRVEQGERISRLEAKYHQDIMEDIKRVEDRTPAIFNCPSLHEMLVYWNLNSRRTIIYFRKGIEQILQTLPQAERVTYLRLQYKYVQQLPERHDHVYDKRNPGVKGYFCAYLSREIEFHEQIAESSSSQVAFSQEGVQAEKIICNLSVDQISLILRALHDLRVISVKSMSVLFKLIVKYLATPNTDNISWENMRRKCYNGERRDIALSREVALQVADKIETY